MANVILYRPREVYSRSISNYRSPLGLLYIAAFLKAKGFSVAIIDTETTDNWLAKLQENMTKDVIMAGVGVMTGYQIKGALDFSKAIKQIKPVPVVWGGLHPSLLPEQTVQHDLVDIVVTGEGEETMAILADKIRHHSPLDSVAGIVYKQEGKITFTVAEKPFLDMDLLDLPDYSLIDTEYYATSKRGFMLNRTRCIDINLDRGCPFRCGFCYNLHFNKRSWRSTSAEKALESIEKLVRLYRLDALNFTSDNFFVNKERVRKICQGLLERNLDIVWHSDMRIDTFLSYEDDLLGMIKKSGCIELTFGVESGSDRMLKLIHKDISVQDVLRAHARARDFGFKVNYHFMIGFPEENRSDIIETLKLIYLLTREKGTKLYGPSTYVPYPGTTLYKRSLEMGFRPPENLEGWIDYDWDNTSKFNWFNKSFKRYLKNVQIVSFMAGTPPPNPFRWLVRHYFRLRLKGLTYGITLWGLDILLARCCVRLVRLFKLRIK